MKFEEVLPALREGKKITRDGWGPSYYYKLDLNSMKIVNSLDDVIKTENLIKFNDWEIVKEIVKEKIKYYPVMIKYSYSSGCYTVLPEKYKSLIDVPFSAYITCGRLIT
jgi:hypothetical protein